MVVVRNVFTSELYITVVDDDIYISGVIPESFIIIFYFSSMCNFDDQENHFQRTLMWAPCTGGFRKK